jgi:tRNA threonylcarbamoyladenosine biosynthesis protein TsaB
VLILALETSSQAGSVALLDCRAASTWEGEAPAEPQASTREGEAPAEPQASTREGEAPAEPQALLGKPAVAPDCDNVLSHRALAADRRSAQTLIPAMAYVLSAAGRMSADVSLVAVTVGPGSFTGLRVGVTAAKSFAYATGCECLGVDTLEVIAEQAPRNEASAAEIQAVLDAQRKELYLARFRIDGCELVRLEENRIVPVERWLADLVPGTVVTGSGINRLVDRLPAGVVAIDPRLREPQAATVGRLAWRQYQAGRRDDLWKLAPKYLRLSAAEEKVGQVFNLPGKNEGRPRERP